MRTLYQGNLNRDFAFRPTAKERIGNLSIKIVETALLTIVSIPLWLYLVQYIVG